MRCLLDDGDLLQFSKYLFETDAFRAVYKDRFVYQCSSCNLKQVNFEAIDNSALDQYYKRSYRLSSGVGVDTTDQANPFYRLFGIQRGVSVASSSQFGRPA